MFLRTLILLSAIVTAGGCTWVKMTPQGASVRVANTKEDLSSCQRRGEIAVTVEDQIGFVGRSRVKVRDELETLARNEAVSLAADTIQPKTEPADGEQRFVAFTCGSRAAAARDRVDTPVKADEAETFPVRNQD